MALGAVGPEAALMLVFVAGAASRRKAEPGVIQVLGRKESPSLRRDMLRIVTGAATDAEMLSIEHVTGLRVIESFWRRIPVEQGKVSAVVIGMALDTGGPCRPRARKSRVETFVVLQLVANLAVTINAAERGRLGGNRMTLDATLRPVQALMRPGKRSRGNLRVCRRADK